MFRKYDLNYQQIFLIIIMLAMIIFISFVAGLVVSNYLPFFSISDNFSLLKQSVSLLKDNFYGTLPESADLEYGMIRGMLTVVGDPYTIFVEPVQHELQTDQLAGSFGGIGARLEWDSEGYLLLFPFADSAAQKAGVHEGDRLVAIGDLKVQTGMTIEEIQAAIRGKIGDTVQLTLVRAPEFSQIIIGVEREEVSLPSVTWNLSTQDQRVGVIQINIIAATTPDEVKRAVLDLQSHQAEYFILDLRNNTGGMLDAGIETTKLFLKQGAFMAQQYRDQPVEEIKNDVDGPFIDIPLTVLINEYSASAAEIIAGSLKGQQRANLVGIKSYGKDTIQYVFDLYDGSSLHVTTAQWWIPGLGYSIHEQGLIPDISLPTEEANSQVAIEAAIKSMLK